MILNGKLVKIAYNFCVTCSFKIICAKNYSANCRLHFVELNMTIYIFSLCLFFFHLVWKFEKIVFSSYCHQNLNFKFQFPPLSNKIGRDWNLGWKGQQGGKGKRQKSPSCVSLDVIRYSKALPYLEILLNKTF